MAVNKNPFGLPTEKIDLPSKGLIYPTDHILSQGFLEVVYPGAKQEDILTDPSYLEKGVSTDKYLESILLTDVQLNDMIPGDRDALVIAARILGLGKKYSTAIRIDKKPEFVTFDLTTFKEREIDFSLFKPGVNEFSYTLERGIDIKFKLLNGFDSDKMSEEETGFKKVKPDYSADTSLYLKYAIIEVDGDRSTGGIRKFVDEKFLAVDIRELKKYIVSLSPGYIWRADGVRANKEIVEDLFVPYTADFFWPAY